MKSINEYLVNNHISKSSEYAKLKDIYDGFKNVPLKDVNLHTIDKSTTIYKTYGEPSVDLFGLKDIQFDFSYSVNKEGTLQACIIKRQQVQCSFTAKNNCFTVCINDLGSRVINMIVSNKCEELGFEKSTNYNVITYTLKME